MNNDIFDYVQHLCANTKTASPLLAVSSTAERNDVLAAIAKGLIEQSDAVLAANSIDVKNAENKGVRASLIDRLLLTEARINSIVDALDDLIKTPDPIGAGERWVRPNGLEINKVKVPIGVVGIIYESRANVTIDVAALCIKSGNSVILRGGSEAIESNKILTSVIRSALISCGFPENCVTLIENTSRDSSVALMQMREYVDVLIPRGSAGLIKTVIETSKIPTIETGAGNCHLYIDSSADPSMGCDIAINAKVSRPSVCNAIETLLVHENVSSDFLGRFQKESAAFGVEIRGCEKTAAIISYLGCDIPLATEDDFFTEFGDLTIAVKVVSSIDEAIAHINHYGTGHSEAIVTKDMTAASLFEASVDCAAVYINASTRFTDGGEFGFGAEIGISTQKLHARGPMGLKELTTDKYLVRGNGQIR